MNKTLLSHQSTCQTLSRKDTNKIMIQTLMFTQMQQNLGQNICESVETTRQLLQQAGPIKTRRIVFNVEKNLHNFIKYPFLERLRDKGTHIRLASDNYINFKTFEKNDARGIKPHPIFSTKLLNQELQKIDQYRASMQEQGVLRKNLLFSSKKSQRAEIKSPVLKDRKQCYSARHSRKNSEQGFNILCKKL